MNHYARKPTLKNQSTNPRALRDAFGAFATGVTVATTVTHDVEPIGFTANSFTSVSLDPPLVLVCIADAALGYEAFHASDHFCINVLAEDQRDVSNIFASQGADKFADVDWQTSVTGAPVLSGVAAYFDCVRHDWVNAGDHGILIGRVVDFGSRDTMPLCYYRGRYASLASSPSNPEREGGSS